MNYDFSQGMVTVFKGSIFFGPCRCIDIHRFGSCAERVAEAFPGDAVHLEAAPDGAWRLKVEIMSSELRMCSVLFMCCKSYKVSVFNQGQLILSGDSVQDINIHQHVVLPHRQKSTGPTTMCLVLVSILRCVSISWH